MRETLQRAFRAGLQGIASSSSSQRRWPSVSEILAAHLRTKTHKRFVTEDPKTLAIAHKIAQKHPWIYEMGVFNPPSGSTKHESKIITLSPLSAAPLEYQKTVRDSDSKEQRNRLLTVGGPSAECAAVLATQYGNNIDVVHVAGKREEANAAHSAHQEHGRHAAALHQEKNRTVHALAPTLLKRSFIAPSLEEIMKPDYIKIDFFLENLKLGNIPIYVGNELYWASDKIRSLLGKPTRHFKNILMGKDSQIISGLVGKNEGVCFSSSQLNEGRHLAITIAMTEKESEEIEKTSDQNAAHIRYRRMSDEEITEIFGEDAKNFYGAFIYEGDCQALFNSHQTRREIVEKKNQTWMEGYEVTKIYLDDAGECAGVECKSVASEETRFIAASHVYVSGGYTAKFEYNKPTRWGDKTERAVPRQDIATGCSITALFRLNEPTQKLIKEHNGRFPEVAISNTHWTLIAQDGEDALVRITGGGNIASEEYPAAYLLNIIENTIRIWGGQFVGVVSAYGCPRAINAQNSGEFVRLSNSVVINFGQGGTGITKQWPTGALALELLGKTEVINALRKESPFLFSGYKAEEITRDYRARTEHFLQSQSPLSRTQTHLAAAASLAALAGIIGAIEWLEQNKEKEYDPEDPTHTYTRALTVRRGGGDYRGGEEDRGVGGR